MIGLEISFSFIVTTSAVSTGSIPTPGTWNELKLTSVASITSALAFCATESKLSLPEIALVNSLAMISPFFLRISSVRIAAETEFRGAIPSS